MADRHMFSGIVGGAVFAVAFGLLIFFLPGSLFGPKLAGLFRLVAENHLPQLFDRGVFLCQFFKEKQVGVDQTFDDLVIVSGQGFLCPVKKLARLLSADFYPFCRHCPAPDNWLRKSLQRG